MNKTLYRHICTKVQLDILWHPGKVFWRCELHKTGCKELHLLVRQLRSRALNTNIQPDQASNRKRFIEKDKWISTLFERFKEGQYSLVNYLFFPFTNPIILRWHSSLSAKVTKNANLGYSHDRGLS